MPSLRLYGCSSVWISLFFQRFIRAPSVWSCLLKAGARGALLPTIPANIQQTHTHKKKTPNDEINIKKWSLYRRAKLSENDKNKQAAAPNTCRNCASRQRRKMRENARAEKHPCMSAVTESLLLCFYWSEFPTGEATDAIRLGLRKHSAARVGPELSKERLIINYCWQEQQFNGKFTGDHDHR